MLSLGVHLSLFPDLLLLVSQTWPLYVLTFRIGFPNVHHHVGITMYRYSLCCDSASHPGIPRPEVDLHEIPGSSHQQKTVMFGKKGSQPLFPRMYILKLPWILGFATWTRSGQEYVVNQRASSEWYSTDKYCVSTVFGNRIIVQWPEF